MLEVIEPGLLTTVQDCGRADAVNLGVPVGGACDTWSLGIANALVGNDRCAAALEMTVLGATFRVLEDCVIGVAGADMQGSVAAGTSRLVRRGETVAFGAAADGSGVRTYLALAGGIDVPDVLGSRSTSLTTGFGGLDGRALRAGDVVRSVEVGGLARTWPGVACPRVPGEVVVRVVRGQDAGAFEELVARRWMVSGRGDRQGIRLAGAPVSAGAMAAGLSRGVTPGTIQLPADGIPIVLLADAQTVGGYAVPAVVISADQPLVGQLGPGDDLRFVELGLGAAQQALREQAADFERLRSAMAAA